MDETMPNTLDTRLDSLATLLREDTSHWAPLVRDMALKVIADTRAALPAPADQPTSQEALTDADIKRVHDTRACLPDLVGMKDQWPEILRFARAVIDADRKARQQEAQALARLWPLFERATKDLVFTAERAGEVMADMNTLRAAIAKGERHDR
jgi:hypothetical protein